MIIDAFVFSNQLDVLEIRLKTLDPYVDLFVLVETGLIFEQNKERFAKWLPKIRHVVTKEEPVCDAILMGLGSEVIDPDIVMVSDVDEIPDLSLVRWEHLPHRAMTLCMWYYQYDFEHLGSKEPWFGTVITQVDLLREYGPNYFRNNHKKFPVQQYTGWYLDKFGVKTEHKVHLPPRPLEATIPPVDCSKFLRIS